MRDGSDPGKPVDGDDEALARAAMQLSSTFENIAARLVHGKATDDDRRAVQMHGSTEHQITENDHPTLLTPNPFVLCLNVAGWIDQARSEGQSAEWLRGHAVRVSKPLGGLPAQAFQNALAPPRRGKPGSVTLAAKLIVEAKLHTDADALAAATLKLRSRSKSSSRP
jgi:hypothetical protein